MTNHLCKMLTLYSSLYKLQTCKSCNMYIQLNSKDLWILEIWNLTIQLINGLQKKGNKLKIENFRRRIGIAEKSPETRRDCWGGNVNHKSLFWLYHYEAETQDSTTVQVMKHYEAETLGHKSQSQNRDLWCLHYQPSNPFLFRGFFQQSLFSFWKFQFFITLVISVTQFQVKI